MRFVLYAILAYIIFQFVFRLVIPVYLASRKIKKGFRDMQNRMQEPFDSAQGNTFDSAQGNTFDSAQGPKANQQNPASPKPEPKTKTGDYIEFEEVK